MIFDHKKTRYWHVILCMPPHISILFFITDCCITVSFISKDNLGVNTRLTIFIYELTAQMQIKAPFDIPLGHVSVGK